MPTTDPRAPQATRPDESQPRQRRFITRYVEREVPRVQPRLGPRLEPRARRRDNAAISAFVRGLSAPGGDSAAA